MKHGKKGTSVFSFVSTFACAASAMLITLATHAGILSVSNQVTIISPPSTVFIDNVDTNIYLFPERTSFTLTNNVNIDISNPGTVTNRSFLSQSNISAGAIVDSYYLHHGGPFTNTAVGSVTFDRDIIGIICLTSNLVTSQGMLGAPGTTYEPFYDTQGYEFGVNLYADGITLSPDRRTVTVAASGLTGEPDDLRVLTAAAPPILPPVINVQSNQVVGGPGWVVAMEGFRSYDPNNPPLPLTYTWTQLSGIPVTLSYPNDVFTTFATPAPPDDGTVLVFQLLVSNGYASSSNFVVITEAGVLNTPPIADAGPNQTVAAGNLVTLDASASMDVDYADTLTFEWSQIAGPVVAITNADAVNPVFFAPAITGGPVTLKFQVIANDGKVDSGPSVVTITVTNVSDVPIADAGPDQTVNELASVALDGSRSSDPGNEPLTYSWTQILGTPVTLSGADTATPTFTAPDLTGGDTNTTTTLTFQLTVSNGDSTNTDTVNVIVKNVNHPPVADAEPNITVPADRTVALIGTNSYDPDGDPLTYSWVQTSGPAVTLNTIDPGSPWFITPDVGPSGATLVFQLTVSDGFGGIATADVTINVTYVNHPPAAFAGTNQTVYEGSIATLAGTASDPDGNTLNIHWTEIGGPPVTLMNGTTLTPSFIAPLVTRDETNVVLELTVDDSYGGITNSDVSIHIANINHPPIAQAPANMSVPEGTVVELIGQGTDPDTEEQSQLVYSWSQTAGPLVAVTNNGADISFTAPIVSDGGDTNAKVTLTFALTVTDPNGASSTSSVDVVDANVDHAPTAIVGNSLMVNEGSSATLNGSASSDPDSDPLTYSWVQVAGPTVTLTGADTALPQFTAPFVGAAGATLQFQLTVNDGFGGTSTATATVTVNNINNPPNVDQAQPSVSVLWPPSHGMVKVSIVGVVDTENNDTIQITGVTQDEPTNGTEDGDTAVDAVINSDGTVLLRAERAGNGNGRVYHIHFTASDFEGSASGVLDVTVPLDRNTAAIDGGELYDSTQ